MVDLRIQLLGPVRAWRDGDPIELGSAAQRAVFGLLVLAGGQPLTRTEIEAGLWLDRQPPASAANVIQTYVKHLRRLLEPDRPRRTASAVLRQVGDGYALSVPGAEVDVPRFRGHVAEALAAQRGGRLDRAAQSLQDALGLWHGPPLADVPVLAAHPRVVALADERLSALVRYGDVMVAVGRAADGLSALEEAAAAQPLNEAWQARLVQAYQAAGRRGKAFATYHEVRRRLADDLGVDPGPELLSAHAALLGADHGPQTREHIPAQLPADPPGFTGRASELARLDSLLDKAEPAAIVVVSGAPGLGKTALAVRWAHRTARRFPDGQLYLNLRGFDPGGAVMDPSDGVRWFLDALGVPAERLPSAVDGQAALYRSQLAGRRMLIVLDNARDAAQLRPLLPGAPGCLVLVTSRHQLPGLVAGEGAHPLPLGLLSADDARGLLAQRVGVDRTEGEPDAVSEIIDHCGGLPLALVIIAARAAMSGNLPLAVLARQLRDDGDRLDALATGDPGTDLRSVFSWSYRVLDADAARLFRLLGVHPGPQISVPAAASLAALTVPTVRRLLAELVRANLVAELGDGRYSLHDLLRTFAAELARPLDGNHSRRAAIRRMLDHYLHSAAAADRLSRPARDPLVLEPPAFGVVPESPPDLRDALRWFTVERTVLIAAVELASTVSARHAWQLAWSLSTFLDLRGHWDELIATQHTAIAAAQRAADPGAQAGAHRLLARAYTRKRRIDDADVQLLRALDLYRGAGDRNGESHTHLNLALLRERQGRHPDALDHARRSLKIFESAGDQYGQACAHNAVGWYHALLGDHPMALRHCRQALARMQALGDRVGQASTWDSLGYAHHHLGQHPRALADFQQALDLYRDLGDRHLEGFVLVHIGDTHDAVGDAEAARSSWEEALGILDDLDQPEAEKLRGKLAASTPALAVAHRRT